jgi:DNA-binding transcriptional LysR family regulator
MHQLELELGGDLFRRERPQAQLTDLGHRMLPLMQQCYQSALSAKSLAASIKSGEVGALRIALSRTIDLDLVMPHIEELNRHFRGLDLKIMRGSAAEVAEFLKRGDAELALVAAIDESWDRFDRWPLFTEAFQLMLHVEHRLAEREKLLVSDLTDERILIRNYCEYTKPIIELLRNANVTVERAHEVWSERDLRTLLESNLGVAVVPTGGTVPSTLTHRTI